MTIAYNFDSPVNNRLTLYAQWNPVTKTDLSTAINAAETAVNAVTVSVDGSNVEPSDQWVTQTVKDAYLNGISAAKTVRDNVNATQAQVDNAKTDLDQAATTFNENKKAGTLITGSASIQINFDGMPTDPVTVSGNNRVAKNGVLTVSVNSAEAYSTFAWYLDENKLTGQTAASCTLQGAILTPLYAGIHELTVIAWKGSDATAVPYSHTITLTVTE